MSSAPRLVLQRVPRGVTLERALEVMNALAPGAAC